MGARMELRFERLPYQWEATAAVCAVFEGQPRQVAAETVTTLENGAEIATFGNAPLALGEPTLLGNLRARQARLGLEASKALWRGRGEPWPLNLDVEMETGTGKTYVYTQTAFELRRRFGWSKFVVVVPTVAIREGVKASLAATAGHFFGRYGARARVVAYDSKRPGELLAFANSPDLGILVINMQAFNAQGKDSRRIRQRQDGAGSHSPLEILAACRLILILDEPQKMEGKRTAESLREFNPLFVLRYSATHKTRHDLVYRLDALDAYNQKLVKRIEVVGLKVRHLAGQGGYLYLAGVEPQRQGPPKARLEFERRAANGEARRVTRLVGRGESLHALSGGMPQYATGYVPQELAVGDGDGGWVRFRNGLTLRAGDVVGDVEAEALREIQVREAIRAHLRREAANLPKGIKTLSLFFIDRVADYRDYGRADQKGPLARLFERVYAEEAQAALDDLAWPKAHQAYLRAITAAQMHAGYFSQDRKTKRAIDLSEKEEEKAGGEAYDLILRDKASLLSLADTERAKVRFLFSHSALREGWDNPNVFVICLFRHTDNALSRRQEVGRGLRLCVRQDGSRWAAGDTHDVNRLTVVTDEACSDFVKGLQQEFAEAIWSRSWAVRTDFLKGREVRTPGGLTLTIDATLSRKAHNWLFNSDYLDADGALNETFRKDRAADTLREGFPRELEPVRGEVLALLDALAAGREVRIANARARERVPVQKENLGAPGFQALWGRLRRKTACTVRIDTPCLIEACVTALNDATHGPQVAAPSVTVTRMEQREGLSAMQVREGAAFQGGASRTEDMRAGGGKVAYDLVGELADPKRTGLTRRTLAAILRRLEPAIRALYAVNPEAFITEAARIINAEKTRQVLTTIAYRPTDACYQEGFFEDAAPEIPKAWCTEESRLRHHLYPWLASDSQVERTFAKEADAAEEVEAFVKLPADYVIPLPNGETYNPDWAIAFKRGAVREVYVVAETKGSTEEGHLRGDEALRKACAEAWVRALAPDESVRYHLVDSFEAVLDQVR